jgi:hypothetical protein
LTGFLPRCFSLLLVGLASAWQAQPAIAKGPHGSHVKASAKAPKGEAPKDENHRPAATGAGSTRDVAAPGSDAPIVRGVIKPPSANAAARPKASQIPVNVPAVGAPSAVTRNAIGVSIAPHETMPGSAAHAVAGTVVHGPNLPAGAAFDPIGHPAPIANANSTGPGKIGGTGLIRPTLAPAGLGGPAKPVAGINGTTLRPRP